MAKKPLEIDMIAGSQLRDTQGEMLSVEGADISDLQRGLGKLNDNHGKGFFNAIGRVTYAKKIFKAEDCTDARQEHYWNQVKAPYIYVKGVLYDDEDHPNARAAAAVLRNIHKADIPLKMKASVEGGVIARGISDPSLLARTKIHSVALTLTPANNATLVEPTSLSKSENFDADMQLIKSVMHLAETDIPSFRHITRDASATKVQRNLQMIADMCGSDIAVPSKEKIIADAIEQKVRNNIVRINELMKAAGSDPMDKGIKEMATGAAMLGATFAGGPHVPPPSAEALNPSAMVSHKPSQEEVYGRVAKEHPLLGAIGMVESSGGKNLKHKTINSEGSLSHGHTAGGMFGMMPNAAQYILKNDPKLAQKYPQYAEYAKDLGHNHTKFTEGFNSDPEMAADFAEALLGRHGAKIKNPDMLIHSWNRGMRGTWKRAKEHGLDAIKNDDYVKNVRSHIPHVDRKVASMDKSLSAGYGGAGAPSALSGGGVFQAEQIDLPKSKFKYVTCDHCGKEQVYSKNQVKCREPDCRTSFSLDKLYDAMKSSR